MPSGRLTIVVRTQHGNLTDEDDLMARVQRGDHAAFSEIARRYRGRMQRLARSMMGDWDSADDVVQSALLRLFTRSVQFKGLSAPGTWIFSITKHEALMALRRRRRMRTVSIDTLEHPDDDGGSPQWFRSHDPGPEELLEAKEVTMQLSAAIEQLPRELREVLLLQYVHGMEPIDIARRLGILRSMAGVRCRNARKELRRKLVRLT